MENREVCQKNVVVLKEIRDFCLQAVCDDVQFREDCGFGRAFASARENEGCFGIVVAEFFDAEFFEKLFFAEFHIAADFVYFILGNVREDFFHKHDIFTPGKIRVSL